MANYKETNVSGSAWTRAVSVRIENPYNDVPSIMFDEENIYVIGDKVIHNPVMITMNSCLKEFMNNPAIEFDIVNPQNNEFIRKATYEEFYTIIYSLYKTLALLRDVMPPVMPPVLPVIPQPAPAA